MAQKETVSQPRDESHFVPPCNNSTRARARVILTNRQSKKIYGLDQSKLNGRYHLYIYTTVERERARTTKSYGSENREISRELFTACKRPFPLLPHLAGPPERASHPHIPHFSLSLTRTYSISNTDSEEKQSGGSGMRHLTKAARAYVYISRGRARGSKNQRETAPFIIGRAHYTFASLIVRECSSAERVLR